MAVLVPGMWPSGKFPERDQGGYQWISRTLQQPAGLADQLISA